MSGQLSLAYWNVDGLFKLIDGSSECKLSFPSFLSHLTKHVIICLVETHCENNNVIQIPGYKLAVNCRSKSPRGWKSFGGLAIAYRDYLHNGVEILPVTSTEFMWMRLKKDQYSRTCNFDVIFHL